MLAHLHLSLQGEGHRMRDMACQDASQSQSLTHTCLGRDLVVAACADGVGSCEFSDVGAQTAVDAFVSCVKFNLLEDEGQLTEKHMTQLLEYAFRYAYARVQERAKVEELPSIMFDSTLTGVVYDGSTMWYGHIGDDGIVALDEDGRCQMVTHRHKGHADNIVIPLRQFDRWEFGTAEHVASLVMMTDGLLDYCVGKHALEGMIYLPFLQPLLYARLDTREDVEGLHTSWEAFLEGCHGRMPEQGLVVLDDVPTVEPCAALEDSAVEGDKPSDVKASCRLRDVVYDDLTVVLISNSESVAHLSEPQFDEEAFRNEVERCSSEVESQLRNLAEARRFPAREDAKESGMSPAGQEAGEDASVRVPPTQDSTRHKQPVCNGTTTDDEGMVEQ